MVLSGGTHGITDDFKGTRERAVSQCIWPLDLTATAWFLVLFFEPFQGLTLTG